MTGIVQTLIGSFGAAAAAVTDAYFNLVTLLLPGNGTNGAQNNTFLDSSTNNFTITRNSNTTQGTFSPFSQTGWSNYFNSVSDYLGFTSISLGASFTFEFFVFFPSAPSSQNVIVSNAVGGGTNWIGINATDITFSYSGTSRTFSFAAAAGTWYYVQLISSSSSVSCYVNGTQRGTAQTGPATFSVDRIGGYSAAGFSGYLSNLRVVNSALSVSTTPTSPLTAITGTQLLTCQSNRFIDNSTNNYAITVTGSPSVQAFSPFAPTAAYSASTNGGSGYFDGNGDYLNFTGTNFNVGTGAFTLEGWIYMTTNQYSSVIATWNAAATGVGFLLGVDNTGKVQFSIGNGNTGNVETILSASAIPLNSWVYLAATKAAGSGGTMTLYVNGTSVGTTTTTRSVDRTAAVIGRYYQDTNNYYLTGYLADVRVSNTVRTISVPTAPLTSDGNTLFLASYTNAGITDATAKNDLETVGNAQISTTQSKFGGSSIYLDGTGDWLLTQNNPVLNLGGGNFTIEGWFNFSVATNGVGYVLVSKAPSGFTPQASFAFWRNTSNKLRFIFSTDGGATNLGTIDTTNNFTPTTGTWYHIAVVRSGSTFYIFIDGTSQALTSSYSGSATSSSAIFNSTTPIYVGAFSDGANSYNGYIDDLRITNYARYTANFTAPTAAFPLQ